MIAYHLLLIFWDVSHTCTQLLGSYKMNAGITHWQDGILTRLLRQIESTASLKQSLNHPTCSSQLHNSQVHTNLICLTLFFTFTLSIYINDICCVDIQSTLDFVIVYGFLAGGLSHLSIRMVPTTLGLCAIGWYWMAC